MRSSSLYLLLAFGSLILFAGCEDTPESTVPTLELNGDAGPRLAVRDAAATNVPVIDATAIQPDPPRGDAPGAGGGDDLDCQPGETRCDDAGERERCDLMGLWQRTPCAETEICDAGACRPDPNQCADGARTCIDSRTPAQCQDDEYIAEAPCGDELACSEGECVPSACRVAADRSSYLGCDYLAVDLPNQAFRSMAGTTPESPIGIVLANPTADRTIEVNLYDPDGDIAPLVASMTIPVPAYISPIPGLVPPVTVSSNVRDGEGMIVADRVARADGLEIPPGGIATLLIGRRMGPLEISSIQRDAFRVKTDHPVVVYQFAPYCCNYSVSNDASLLYPTTALGTHYRFVGAPYVNDNPIDPENGDDFPPVIAVVAPNDGTEVTIELPNGARIRPDENNRIRTGPRGVEANLDAQDVMLILGDGTGTEFDLTGADIRSNEPVAVFSVHVCTFYPESTPACDHLQEQLMPVSTWGTTFQLAPPSPRGPVWSEEAIYWKLIGTDDETRIRLSVPFAQLNAQAPGFDGVTFCGDALEGADTIVLRNGEHCEFGTKLPVQAVADNPMMILGFISGQVSTQAFFQAGDPAVFLVPPDRQYRREYTLLVPDTYANDFVTIVSPAENEIILDGAPVSLADATPIPGSQFVLKHIQVTDGPHNLLGRGPFGVWVYAYDNYVSYAYTGGMNLTKR